MATNSGCDADNMMSQRQTKHCKGVPEICSDKKQHSNWSPKAWVWRISNAAMVVFFVTAAYVQVRTALEVVISSDSETSLNDWMGTLAVFCSLGLWHAKMNAKIVGVWTKVESSSLSLLPILERNLFFTHHHFLALLYGCMVPLVFSGKVDKCSLCNNYCDKQ